MPGVLLDLLNQVCQEIPKRQRAHIQVTLSAEKQNLSIIGNGMVAGVSIKVTGQGQCKVGWRRFADILETFPAKTPVRIACNRDRLQINTFSMEVEGYTPEAVPQNQPIPVVPSPDTFPTSKQAKRKVKETAPIRTIAADGYSLAPPAPEDDEITGTPGHVSPDDTKAPREPVVCPACQSVGYFKKYEISCGTFFRSNRSWAVARVAPTVVVLKGNEEPKLCPRCLLKRLQGSRHIETIAGEQPDMYEEEAPPHTSPT